MGEEGSRGPPQSPRDRLAHGIHRASDKAELSARAHEETFGAPRVDRVLFAVALR